MEAQIDLRHSAAWFRLKMGPGVEGVPLSRLCKLCRREISGTNVLLQRGNRPAYCLSNEHLRANMRSTLWKNEIQLRTHLYMYSRHMYMMVVSRLQVCILRESSKACDSPKAIAIFSVFSSLSSGWCRNRLQKFHSSILRQYRAQIDSFGAKELGAK